MQTPSNPAQTSIKDSPNNPVAHNDAQDHRDYLAWSAAQEAGGKLCRERKNASSK